MFWKKIIFLAAGYVAGNIVSSLYTSKKGKELFSDLKNAKKDGSETRVFVSNMMETQKNLFLDIKKSLPKEYQNTFDSKLKEFTGKFQSLKKLGEKILQDIEEKWVSKVSKSARNIEKKASILAKKAEQHQIKKDS